MLAAVFASILDSVVVDVPATLTATKITVDPTPATASITFKRDGAITNHNGTQIGTWITPRHSTIGDGYKVKFARTSGDTISSGAAADDTYTTDISTDRTWSNTHNPPIGIRSTAGTFTVANLAESQSDASNTGGITISAEVTS